MKEGACRMLQPKKAGGSFADPCRKLRKYENQLVISGMAVVAFSVWNLGKLLFQLIFHYDAIVVAAMENSSIDMESLRVFVSVCALLVGALLSLPSLIAGHCAIRVGKGAKGGYGYIILDGLLILFSALNMVVQLLTGITGAPVEEAVSVFIELSSLSASLELLIAAIMVARIRKKRAMEVC